MARNEPPQHPYTPPASAERLLIPELVPWLKVCKEAARGTVMLALPGMALTVTWQPMPGDLIAYRLQSPGTGTGSRWLIGSVIDAFLGQVTPVAAHDDGMVTLQWTWRRP